MRPLRWPGVSSTLAWLFSTYLRLVFRTLRWEEVDVAKIASVRSPRAAPANGIIICFWHSGIPLSPFAWPHDETCQQMGALISRSHDGEFIARTMERLGVPSIRGSSAKKSNLAKNKHGEQAFRDMARWVNDGGAIAITPDGPRGPARRMGEGPAALARITGAPVMFMGIACRPSFRLGTWDRTVAPLPFGRAVVVWDGPVHVTRADDLTVVPAQWTARLDAAEDRAWALLDDPRGE